jgi:hypothetical protein
VEHDEGIGGTDLDDGAGGLGRRLRGGRDGPGAFDARRRAHLLPRLRIVIFAPVSTSGRFATTIRAFRLALGLLFLELDAQLPVLFPFLDGANLTLAEIF